MTSVGLRIKKALKSMVRFLERVLPPPAFDRLYRSAFPVYRALVWALYLARGLMLYGWRDAERWRMVRDIHRAMPYTLVGVGGLEATYQLAVRMMDDGVPGDFVELGVARGGCAALLGAVLFERRSSRAADGRRLLLFDSYEGLPQPGPEDLGRDLTTGDHVRPLPLGSCLGTLDEVRDLLLQQRGFPEPRVQFVKGWFQDTIPAISPGIGEAALL